MNTEAEDPSNPYGKGNWELHFGSFHIIHKNGTELEMRHDPFSLSKVSLTILKENSSWAKMRIGWKEKEFNTRYWRNHDLDYHKNITIIVRKSNNMAFIKPSDKLIGFNPFFVYGYTNTKITNEGNGKVTLDLDKKYIAYYISEYSARFSDETFRIRNCLNFVSKKEIQYKELYLGNNPITTKSILEVTSKGHYPINFEIVLPAEFIIKNCTSQKYVKLSAGLGSNQDGAEDFLNSINNGGEPSYLNPFPWRLIAIPVLIIPSAGVGYLAYRKRKG